MTRMFQNSLENHCEKIYIVFLNVQRPFELPKNECSMILLSMILNNMCKNIVPRKMCSVSCGEMPIRDIVQVLQHNSECEMHSEPIFKNI